MNHTLDGAYFTEGHSTTRPPYFNRRHYSHWKARMRIFIQATDYLAWDVIINGPKIPRRSNGTEKPQSDWDEEDYEMIATNARAINILYCAVSGLEYDKISSCETAKEMWDKLEVTHEGTSKVKQTKINMQTYEFEIFKVKDDEKIEDMFTRFSKIVGELKALGKVIPTEEQNYKVLRSLPKNWQSKVDNIESGDLDQLSYD